jgi:hypothetical protein
MIVIMTVIGQVVATARRAAGSMSRVPAGTMNVSGRIEDGGTAHAARSPHGSATKMLRDEDDLRSEEAVAVAKRLRGRRRLMS